MRTVPPPGTPFRFAVVGDSGDLSPESFALARRIRAGRPDFLIHVGDLAYPKGTFRQLDRRFFRPYRRVLERVPLYPTPGNHDYGSRSGYGMAFAPVAGGLRAGKAYAFEWAGAHFVSVPSPDVAAPDTAGWLARRLEGLPRDGWRTVFLHEPPYSPGVKRVTPGLRATLAPMLEGARARFSSGPIASNALESASGSRISRREGRSRTGRRRARAALRSWREALAEVVRGA